MLYAQKQKSGQQTVDRYMLWCDYIILMETGEQANNNASMYLRKHDGRKRERKRSKPKAMASETNGFGTSKA